MQLGLSKYFIQSIKFPTTVLDLKYIPRIMHTLCCGQVPIYQSGLLHLHWDKQLPPFTLKGLVIWSCDDFFVVNIDNLLNKRSPELPVI